MIKQILKDFLFWGITLWLVGYLLGIIFFLVLPSALIGWVIMPIGLTLMLWILFKKIKNQTLQYYFLIAIFWTVIAILLDYLFLVKLFKPTQYYKIDVYIYYFLTFLIPISAGVYKNIQLKKSSLQKLKREVK